MVTSCILNRDTKNMDELNPAFIPMLKVRQLGAGVEVLLPSPVLAERPA